MDLFLLHCLLLLWASIGAARSLTRQPADRLLTAALLAWGNLVVTSLLLAAVNRLGEPGWFLGTSAVLAASGCLLGLRVRPEPDSPPPDATNGPANPWLLGAFFLTLAPLAYASLRIGCAYEPNQLDALAVHLPRAMFYLGQNNLAPFAAADLRQVALPFNFNLLQLFGLIYGAPLVGLNLINLLAWAVAGLAIYRVSRLGALGVRAALIATWLALAAPPVLAQASESTAELPAGAALLGAVAFALRWHRSRLKRDGLLAGLAVGLAAGSSLSVLVLVPVAAILALAGLFRAGRREGLATGLTTARLWIGPALLASAVGAPFAIINLMATGSLLPRANTSTGVDSSHFFSPILGEGGVGFGFTGPLFLVGAVACLALGRRISRPISALAWLGLGGLIANFFLNPYPAGGLRDLVPVFLVLSLCFAALLSGAENKSTAVRWVGALLVLGVALSVGRTAADFLLDNPRRPLAPLLAATPGPPRLPALPLLLEFRLAEQTRINFDSDGRREPVFALMAQGRRQRFTARGQLQAGAYNVLSRASSSRDIATAGGEQSSAYALVAIPTKTTAGVEFLGVIGAGATARDYFGIAPDADRVAPVDGNRMAMVTFYFAPPGPTRFAQTRVKVSGLNPNDHARLAVDVEYADGSEARLAAFPASGEATVSITKPVRLYILKAEDQATGGEIGRAAITDAETAAVVPPKPLDLTLPSGAGSIFVTDLVTSKAIPPVGCTGLLPVEGPFPQWNLPFVRWAKQSTVVLKIARTEHLARLQVSFSVQPQVRHRAELEVFFNGKLVRHCLLPERTVWVDQTLDLVARAGENVLEFRDASFLREPDWLEYLERYPDVKDSLVGQPISPAEGARTHYETHGRAEGRVVPERPTAQRDEPAQSFYFLYRSLRVEGFKSP